MRRDVVYARKPTTLVIICHRTIIFCEPEPRMFVHIVKIIRSHVIKWGGGGLNIAKDGKVFFAFSKVSVFLFRDLPSLLLYQTLTPSTLWSFLRAPQPFSISVVHFSRSGCLECLKEMKSQLQSHYVVMYNSAT